MSDGDFYLNSVENFLKLEKFGAVGRGGNYGVNDNNVLEAVP